jgi:hypothetical protein
MTLRQVHRLAGLATVIVFVGTGAYMHFRYDHLRGMTDATRLLFRSTHIYLFFTGLLNLALGLYFSPARDPWARRLQLLGSILILAAPVLELAAFMREPFLGGLQRPFTAPAVYAALAGMLLHLASQTQSTNSSAD